MIRVVALLAAISLVAVAPDAAFAQLKQGPDPDYKFGNTNPAWGAGEGPLIVFSAHNSVFVKQGSHEPLANLAKGDGFRIATRESALPGDANILVLINNYLATYKSFPAMEPPSAFSAPEIDAVKKWVEAGGSLLMLADHAPLGGGASQLGAALGFTFLNGHVAENKSADNGYAHVILDFRRGFGLNENHPIADGSTGRRKIDRFFAFGGQAFIPPPGATTLLTIPDGWSAFFTYNLRGELASAPRIDASGMAQGAVAELGKGRVAVFGEAGAFSAQIVNGATRIGFDTPEGADNPEFILALLRWLARYQLND